MAVEGGVSYKGTVVDKEMAQSQTAKQDQTVGQSARCRIGMLIAGSF